LIVQEAVIARASISEKVIKALASGVTARHRRVSDFDPA
jgi:hypothetical protein